VKRVRVTHSLFDPAAIRAVGDKREPIVIASCDKARFETPWQDRQTLFASPP
jgi:hypothetical protein